MNLNFSDGLLGVLMELEVGMVEHQGALLNLPAHALRRASGHTSSR